MPTFFLDPTHWIEIKRGYFFEAAIFYPSDTDRQSKLKFFVPDADDKNRGTVVEDVGDFNMRRIEGHLVNVEQQILVTLKPRKVVVISNDKINHSSEFEYIQVAPVMSIDEEDKKKSWYSKTKSDNHPAFVYFPKSVTGKECYADISEIMSIHKSMLQKRSKEVPEDRMNVLEENILECLDLGLIEEDIKKDASNE